MKKLGILFVTLALAIVATPSANAEDVEVQGKDGTWVWTLNNDLSDGIDEVEFFDAEGNEIVGDGYDDFIEIEINGVADDNGTRTFSKNWVQVVITANETSDIEIFGDLGCDSDCVYVLIGGRLFSYEENGGQPDSDPIFMWETDGTVNYEDGDDEPNITKNGTSLTFKHYAYAFENDYSLTLEEFLALFAQWVDEDNERTDIFTTAWSAGKDRNFWSAVEDCRTDLSSDLAAGKDVSASTFQSCFFTGVNSANSASVNAQLKSAIAAAAKAGKEMDQTEIIRTAAQIADRLDLVQRLSTGKLVFASEFTSAGINLGALPTKTLDALKALPASEIDTLEEVLAQIAKVA